MIRLSELLERIRPAGSPGAPAEGELERRSDRRADEVLSITCSLASFESEADAVVATARAEAGRIRDDGQRRARDVAASLSDRIAIAGAEAAQTRFSRDQFETSRLRTEADQAIVKLRERVEVQIPELVTEVLETIWTQIEPEPPADPDR